MPSDADLEATLALLTGRLGRLNEALMHDVARGHGRTAAEYRVLSLLRFGDGAVNPTDIARFVVQTSGGLTATLRRLEADGLVERVPDPDDGRGRLVALTERGAEVHAALFDDLVDRYRLAFADVDGPEALAVVRRLVRGFERLAGMPTTGDWTLAGGVDTGTGRP